jgi:membrane complex biogenesis BtpA family protein
MARRAADEAAVLADAGFDALIVENMHDAPYLLRTLGPEVVSAMTRIADEIARRVDTPLGVQILSGAPEASLAVAHAVGARFIRVENFVFAHVADEGLMHEAAAGPLLRYRKAIGAEDVAIFADIKKKHASHAITADLSIEDAASNAAFFGADALIVTGVATAHPTDADDCKLARNASRLPVIVGSGAEPVTLADLAHAADAVIVGSWIKRDDHWARPVDPDRARTFAEAWRAALNA